MKNRDHGSAPAVASMSRQALLALVACMTIVAPGSALAFSFEPTQVEYDSWSRFCQVSYALGIKQSPFIGDITQEEKDKLWRVKHRYGGPWHYCTARIWLRRARTAETEKKRTFALERAAANANFTYLNVKDNPSFKALAAIRYARALRGLKEYEQALKVLQSAQSLAPQEPGTYSMLSMIYQDLDKDDLAIDALEKGNDATGGKSAEINYFLGLLYLDLGNLEKARAHADIAYDLGYPLPGLKNKLEQASKRVEGE